MWRPLLRSLGSFLVFSASPRLCGELLGRRGGRNTPPGGARFGTILPPEMDIISEGRFFAASRAPGQLDSHPAAHRRKAPAAPRPAKSALLSAARHELSIFV